MSRSSHSLNKGPLEAVVTFNKKIGESKNTRRNLNILCGECGIIRNKERIEEQAKQIPIYTPDLRKCSLEEINKLLVDAKAVLDELKKKEEVSIK